MWIASASVIVFWQPLVHLIKVLRIQTYSSENYRRDLNWNMFCIVLFLDHNSTNKEKSRQYFIPIPLYLLKKEKKKTFTGKVNELHVSSVK